MNEYIAHSGTWGIALIVIVLVSWFIYRYLAPRTWKEWAGAGVVQAFIIALYAEMYGFPLTIYLLVRYFGIDQTNLNANLWSTLLGYGESGMMISMIIGYLILFAGIGIFIEGWRELHRARQEHRLRVPGLIPHWGQWRNLLTMRSGRPTERDVALVDPAPAQARKESRSD